jgi:hypothetical protein
VELFPLSWAILSCIAVFSTSEILVMNGEFDIFEKFPDGKLVWRAVMFSHELAVRKGKELAADSRNEFVIMRLPEKAVIAIVDAKSAAS